jgi:uncharacterized protein YcfJ
MAEARIKGIGGTVSTVAGSALGALMLGFLGEFVGGTVSAWLGEAPGKLIASS